MQQITWESTTAAFPAEMDSASSSSSTSCFSMGTWGSRSGHCSVVLLTNSSGLRLHDAAAASSMIDTMQQHQGLSHHDNRRQSCSVAPIRGAELKKSGMPTTTLCGEAPCEPPKVLKGLPVTPGHLAGTHLAAKLILDCVGGSP